MSADNFLGIYKKDNGIFVGRNCWSECDRYFCQSCPHTPVFATYFVLEAVRLAKEACQGDVYEYGYRFLNLEEVEMTDLHDLNTRNDPKCRGEEAETRGDKVLIWKFGSKRPSLDNLCSWCGERYGAHTYDKEVDAYTFCPVLAEQKKEDWQERLKKFWVCWVRSTTVNTFYRHYTLLEAENEAERLAKLPNVQGKTVYLFECVGKCNAEPPIVAWVVPCETLSDDDFNNIKKQWDNRWYNRTK